LQPLSAEEKNYCTGLFFVELESTESRKLQAKTEYVFSQFSSNFSVYSMLKLKKVKTYRQSD
jgi:hypothetical protein